MTSVPDHDPDLEPAPQALEALLCFDLYAASRAVTARYRPLLGDLGLTYPQYLVLVLLHERPRLAVKEIAASLRLDHGTLTPLLRRMQAAGLVTRRRSERDERVVEIAVTEVGDRLRSRFEEVQCAIRDAMGLDEEQAHDLQQRLRALTEALGTDDDRLAG